jgi:surface antigen
MSRCDTYAPGNCTAGACEDNPWIPEGLGDGGDWAANAAARGFQVLAYPVIGSVVCYCRGDGYSAFGHVASVVDVAPDGRFEVHEENFTGFAQWDFRWSNLGDVCGFIMPPPGYQGQGQGQTGGGPGGSVGPIPWQPQTAWDNVRSWTHELGAELYARSLNVANFADQLGQ